MNEIFLFNWNILQFKETIHNAIFKNDIFEHIFSDRMPNAKNII